MKTERGALLLSCFTALAMGAMGLVFAFLTNSRAIMLDGVYNLTYFGVGLLTMRVARLALKPDTPEFPFGHGYFESLVNAGKGLMILGISAIALVDSVMALFTGGRAIAAGPAIVYAATATALCTIAALALRRARQRLASPLVQADAENWVLDAVISAAVLLAFCLAPAFEAFGWTVAARYIDPLLVAAVVLLFLGVPVRMAREAIGELLNRAPDPSIAQPVTEAIDAVLAGLPVRERYVRMVRPGRTLYVAVHTVLEADFPAERLAVLDDLRARLDQAIRGVQSRVVVDAVFTADRRWAVPTAGLEDPGTPAKGGATGG